jgi:hypothetical protein
MPWLTVGFHFQSQQNHLSLSHVVSFFTDCSGSSYTLEGCCDDSVLTYIIQDSLFIQGP